MAEPEGKMPETEVQSAEVAVDTMDAEPFDKERAMETIRKQREEVKQVKKLAQELEKYKQAEEARKLAEMSETDRLKAELDQMKGELKAKTVRTMQIEVAAKLGIPAALSDRLHGETLEEMEEDAKAILDMLPKQKAAPNTGATNPGDKAGSGDTFEDEHKRWKAAQKQSTNPFTGGGVFYPPKLGE